GGTLVLNGANNYGTTAGASGAAVDGGTIVRSGTVLLGHSSALGTATLELGDTRSLNNATIDRATTGSLMIAGSVFNPNGDGVTATSGGQTSAGTPGGALIGVWSTVDGFGYTVGDVGKLILVKDEEAAPERNGVYSIVSVAGSTMNLVRAAAFDTANEMTYGVQLTVPNGTQAGTYFMTQPSVVVANQPGASAIRFRQESGNSTVAALANADGLTVVNAVDVNATVGTSSVTLGGSSSLTTGNALFSGNVVLQSLVPGAESKTLTLTSSTSTTTGITFSGQISQADTALDALHLEKEGSGIVTLSGNNNYVGSTAVNSGTLQLAPGGSINDTTWIRVDSGAVFGTAVAGYTTDAVVSGTGTLVGQLTVGNNVGSVNAAGILKPGASTGGVFANAGDLVGTLTVNGDLLLAGGATRLELQLGNSGVADANASTDFGLRLGNGTFGSWIGDNSDGHLTAWEAGTGNHDHVAISGALSLSSGGQVRVTNLAAAALGFGDVFDLIDWGTLNLGSFDKGGLQRSGGLIGDLELPLLGATLTYDLSVFESHGIIVIVPEPSRLALLLMGTVVLAFRRRRCR
ncbi:MAG: autotransporter-associated beta strand repeat-containing protein, partial [Roseimicrobium sp.]